LAAIGILAVLRLEVVDFGVEQLVFQAGLERMPARNLRVIDFGIPTRGSWCCGLLAAQERDALMLWLLRPPAILGSSGSR
jgi:hypothetical protein